MFLETQIRGRGTVLDPYRPLIGPNKDAYSAVIPSEPDGTPSEDSCIVALPDNASIGFGKSVAAADAIARVLAKRPGLDVSKIRVPGMSVVPLSLGLLGGYLASTKSPVDRRWMLKAGLFVAGGLVFSHFYNPRLAWGATRNSPSISDDFNRANNTDLGTNWDPYTGKLTGRVENNMAEPVASGSNNMRESWNASTPPNNQWSQVWIIRLSTAGGYVNAGVTCRGTAPNTETSYAAQVQSDSAFLSKYVTGSFFSLGAFSQTTGGAPSKTLALEVIGSGLECFWDGVSVLTAADTDIASGRVGLVSYIDTGAVTGDVRMDDFTAGDFAALNLPLRSLMGVGQ